MSPGVRQCGGPLQWPLGWEPASWRQAAGRIFEVYFCEIRNIYLVSASGPDRSSEITWNFLGDRNIFGSKEVILGVLPDGLYMRAGHEKDLL